MGNVAAGALVPYLVGTAWMAVRRREGTVGLFEKLALIVVLGVAAGFVTQGIQASLSLGGKLDGYPMYLPLSLLPGSPRSSAAPRICALS